MKELSAVILALFVTCSVSAGECRTESCAKEESAGSQKRNNVLPPIHTEKYEYYDVCGCCEKDLQCEMSDKAIRWKDGNRYDSVTNWKVKWDYSYNRDEHTCLTESFRLNVEIMYHLPKWKCTGHAPSSLSQKWESYISNLVLHEKGHGDKALKAAEEITRAVADMAPARSCSELDTGVQKLCSDSMKQLDQEQEGYDAATGHGQAKGVAFP